MAEPIRQRVEIDDAASGALARVGAALQEFERAVASLTGRTDEQSQAAGEFTDEHERMGDAAERAGRSVDRAGDAVEGSTVAARDAAAAQRRLGESFTGAAGAARGIGGATKDVADQLAGMVGKITPLMLALMVSRAVTESWDRYTASVKDAARYLQESARFARENAEARLDLAALQGMESPEQVNALNQVATFAGRAPRDVYAAKTFINSQLPQATEEQRGAVLMQAAAQAQLSSAPMSQIAAPVVAIYRQLVAEGADPTDAARQASNIYAASVKGAGEADPAKLGEGIGKFIALGKNVGGMDTGTAAGFAAAVTGVGLPTDPAITALGNVTFALSGQGTPEGGKIIERERIRRDVEGGLQDIARGVREGRIAPAELELLGGREAAPLFAALSDEKVLGDVLATVRGVRDAGRASGSINRGDAARIMEPGSVQSYNLLAKQAEAETNVIRSGGVAATNAAAISVFNRAVADAIERKAITPRIGQVMSERFAEHLAMGKSPEDAARYAEAAPDVDSFVYLGGKQLVNPLSLGGATYYGSAVLGMGEMFNADARNAANAVEGPFVEQWQRGPTLQVNGPYIVNGRDPITGDLGGPARR